MNNGTATITIERYDELVERENELINNNIYFNAVSWGVSFTTRNETEAITFLKKEIDKLNKQNEELRQTIFNPIKPIVKKSWFQNLFCQC